MVIIRDYDWVQTNQNDLSFGGKLYEVFLERAKPQENNLRRTSEPQEIRNPIMSERARNPEQPTSVKRAKPSE